MFEAIRFCNDWLKKVFKQFSGANWGWNYPDIMVMNFDSRPNFLASGESLKIINTYHGQVDKTLSLKDYLLKLSTPRLFLKYM